MSCRGGTSEQCQYVSVGVFEMCQRSSPGLLLGGAGKLDAFRGERVINGLDILYRYRGSHKTPHEIYRFPVFRVTSLQPDRGRAKIELCPA